MAGSAGGDGLGKIAITYGLNYREYDIMYVSSLLLVALVQIIQIAGNLLIARGRPPPQVSPILPRGFGVRAPVPFAGQRLA